MSYPYNVIPLGLRPDEGPPQPAPAPPPTGGPEAPGAPTPPERPPLPRGDDGRFIKRAPEPEPTNPAPAVEAPPDAPAPTGPTPPTTGQPGGDGLGKSPPRRRPRDRRGRRTGR